MTTAKVLDSLKEFIETNVSKKIKLQRAEDSNILNYELVHPNVFVGWIPPGGCLPQGTDHQMPCIIVGMDNGSDDDQKLSCDIRLSFAVFSPGEHIPDDAGEINYIQSYKGYMDLLNLMDLTKAELIKHTIINNTLKVEGKITWGMYDEQSYPYWYGHMRFAVKGAAYSRTNIEKLL
jgi:hypothetical protein